MKIIPSPYQSPRVKCEWDPIFHPGLGYPYRDRVDLFIPHPEGATFAASHIEMFHSRIRKASILSAFVMVCFNYRVLMFFLLVHIVTLFVCGTVLSYYERDLFVKLSFFF